MGCNTVGHNLRRMLSWAGSFYPIIGSTWTGVTQGQPRRGRDEEIDKRTISDDEQGVTGLQVRAEKDRRDLYSSVKYDKA